MVRKQRVLPLPLPVGTQLPRVAEPPIAQYPFWDIMPIGPREHGRAVILSDAAVVWNTHFIDSSKRTVPCHRNFASRCPYCKQLDRKFHAFLAVRGIAPGTVQIRKIPKMTVEQNQWLQDRSDLAGFELSYARLGIANRSRITLQLSLAPVESISKIAIVEWRYLQKVLLNIWGWTPTQIGDLKMDASERKVQ